MYAYFIEGSIERALMLFELDESKEGPHQCEEEVRLLDGLVPVFTSESERAHFEQWVTGDWEKLLTRLGSAERIRRVPTASCEDEGRCEKLEKIAAESAAIVAMLEEYRREA